MGSKAKYSSGMTAEDFLLMVAAEERQHGLLIECRVGPSHTNPGYYRVTIELLEAAQSWQTRKPIKVGQGLAKGRDLGYWATLSYLVHTVLNDYANDPWNWTEVDRRRESAINNEVSPKA